MRYKVLVAGRRDFKDEGYVWKKLDAYLRSERPNLEIITGGASGVDTYAINWAIQRAVPHVTFRPQYDRYPGHIAPLKRNDIMVDECNSAIVFWEGDSSGGTFYTIRELAREGKPFRIISTSEKALKYRRKLAEILEKNS